jgi:hypothetical protein
MKNKATLSFQKYGTSILIFVQGVNPQAAYDKWLSLANWGATSLLNGEEPKYVADNVISCWSTLEQLQRYLFNQHIMRLWDTQGEKFKGVKGGFSKQAFELAKADFESITTESFRSVNSNFEVYEFGTICAEKPDDDFATACLNYAFSYKRA